MGEILVLADLGRHFERKLRMEGMGEGGGREEEEKMRR
jgi:hypothetical protein